MCISAYRFRLLTGWTPARNAQRMLYVVNVLTLWLVTEVYEGSTLLTETQLTGWNKWKCKQSWSEVSQSAVSIYNSLYHRTGRGTRSLIRWQQAKQGRRCQDSLLSRGGRSVRAKISGEGVVPGEYFLVSTKLDTFCYPTVQTAPCYVLSFWHNTHVWLTDGQTDGIAVASTALAMRTLRRAVKTGIRH